MAFWRNLSISTKLYVVVGVMASLIALELMALRFSMEKLSAVRAFVDGESSWSKAQKDAIFSLQRYATSLDEADYQEFLQHLKVPEGDHIARVELEKADPDFDVIRQGFIQGRIHPADVDNMVNLLREFYWVSYIAEAIQSWRKGDESLSALKSAGADYHAAVTSVPRDTVMSRQSLDRIHSINVGLTPIEFAFSQSLGAGSRWLEHVVISLLFFVVLSVETFGLTLTFRTTRYLSKGLRDLNEAAQRVGRGDFNYRLPVQSLDEIGVLTESINAMGSLLEISYRNLEERVSSRTAELAQLAALNARLYDETKDALQQRDDFLSIASHELKTPLTALLLQLQLVLRVERKKPNPQPNDLIERSVIQTQKLAALIEQLLDLTRVQAGRFELQKTECNLAAIVQESIHQTSAETYGKSHLIQIEGEKELMCTIDPMRINQVITNLLSNALKYGDEKPITVRLSRKGEFAEISVHDDGVGIPAESQAKIFNRFERIENASRRPGLGLGLYITKQIVEAHGGNISFVSAMNMGSTFTVSLPHRDVTALLEG